MRILLIHPRPRTIYKANFFPMGLAYLAAMLEQKGFETRILDMHFSPDSSRAYRRLQSEIADFMPAIIGIGCLFSSYYPNAIEISRRIKSIDDKLIVVLGGLHPTIFHKEILPKVESIDYIILGEGEKSFLNLCSGIKDRRNLEGVDGLAYRTDGGINVNPKTDYINDLDEIPFPAYDKFKMEKYFYHYWYNRKNRGMSIVTSRSCPNRCTFCSMFISHGTRWRARSPENVLDEMDLLYNKYNVRHFMFMDDNMTLQKPRVMKIFEGILERQMTITFNFPNGVAVNTLDRDVIEIMKQAGCIEIALAIESGSEYIRNQIIGKKLSNDKIFRVIELCNEYKIDTKAFIIIGMPEENLETMQENINFVKQLKGNLAIDFVIPQYATPFPGTALYNQCMREKLIDGETMTQLVEGRIHAYDRPVIHVKGVSVENLTRYRHKLLRMFVRQNFLRLMLKFALPKPSNFRFLTVALRRLNLSKYS